MSQFADKALYVCQYYLHEFPGEVIGKKLFFLLIIPGKCFLLILQCLDLFKQCVADVLFFLLCPCLLKYYDKSTQCENP